MPIMFIKKYNIMNNIFGEKNSHGQQRTQSDNVGKENMGYSRHNCLRNDNHSPQWKVGSPETTTFIPLRHWLPSQTGLANSTHRQGHRTKAPFVLSSGLLGKSCISLAPHIHTLTNPASPARFLLPIYSPHISLSGLLSPDSELAHLCFAQSGEFFPWSVISWLIPSCPLCPSSSAVLCLRHFLTYCLRTPYPMVFPSEISCNHFYSFLFQQEFKFYQGRNYFFVHFHMLSIQDST